jgi:hypothetical protein
LPQRQSPNQLLGIGWNPQSEALAKTDPVGILGGNAVAFDLDDQALSFVPACHEPYEAIVARLEDGLAKATRPPEAQTATVR